MVDSRVVVALCLALCTSLVSGHMRNWNVPGECNLDGIPCSESPGVLIPTDEANDCLSHPQKAYAGHDTPLNDTETFFSGFYEGTRRLKPDEPFCPGKHYGAWIQFPYPQGKGRQALLTIEKGKMAVYPATCDAALWNDSETFEFDQQCPGNHISWGQITRAEVIAFNLTFPCSAGNVSNADETFKMKLTSSGGPGDNYKQMEWSNLKLAASCGKTPCKEPKAIPPSECTEVLIRCEASETGECILDQSEIVCGKDVGYKCPPGSKPSDKGYNCMREYQAEQGPVKLHFSYDKVAKKCRPQNPCTTHPKKREYGDLQQPALDSLHVLLEAKNTGYLSLGFAQDAAVMNATDSIFGWYNTAEDINYIYVLPLGDQISPQLFQKLSRQEYLLYASMSYDNATGMQSLCFARQTEIALSRNTTFPSRPDKNATNIPNVPVLDYTNMQLSWALHDTVKSIVVHTKANRGSIVLRDLNATGSPFPAPTAAKKAAAAGRFAHSVVGMALLAAVLAAFA